MATETDQFYWHTVYKISDILSPRDDNKTCSFDDDSKDDDAPTKRLTLLSGNMGAEEEISLRSILMLKKDLWFVKGDAESIVTLLEPDEPLQDVQSQLYCRAIFSKFSDELDYLVCFLSASKSGLELFQSDLDKFSSKLVPHLQKYTDSNDTNEYWKEFEDWHSSVLSFIKECLVTFDYDLATLLCAGFCGDTVIINDSVPKDVKKNLERFLQCCSLSALFSESKSETEGSSSTSSLTDLISLQNPDKIHVDFDSNSQYTVEPKKLSTFCNDCIKQLKVNQNIDMVHMRQMLENFKLKSIQDMNTFRRLLTQAEVDFYACYKTYLFLLTSGNGLVLMRNSRLQNNMEHTTKRQEVLDTLEQFITKMGGFGSFDTKEQKEILTNKIGSLRYH